LEDVAPEIRIQIMQSIADFPSLRNLILASPSYRATYAAGAREKILRGTALDQLDSRLHADALAAVRSTGFYDKYSNSLSSIVAFLTDYERARGGGADSQSEWLKCRDLNEAVSLLHLHEAITQAVNDYGPFIASRMKPVKKPPALSEMEKLRLYRAMYRYEIYCNIFGGMEKHSKFEGDESHVWPKESHERFLPSFPPWEVQEIACIWAYLPRRWGVIFREVSDIYFPIKFGHPGCDPDSDMEDTFEHLRRTRHDTSDGNYLPLLCERLDQTDLTRIFRRSCRRREIPC
jgi:hypothetical protein